MGFDKCTCLWKESLVKTQSITMVISFWCELSGALFLCAIHLPNNIFRVPLGDSKVRETELSMGADS